MDDELALRRPLHSNRTGSSIDSAPEEVGDDDVADAAADEVVEDEEEEAEEG